MAVSLQTPEHLQCDCGSGDPFERHYDGHGIYLFRSCDKCFHEKASHFRSDIFEDYECDEPIDED
jgi:hypothetical protein